MPLDALAAFLERSGLAETPERLAALLSAFAGFRAALYEYNARVHLTRVPFEDCEIRHFVDSLLPVHLFPEGASVLDIGTGAGLPAWPMALVRQDLRVMALDSANKPLAFLATQPLPNLELRQGRAEVSPDRERFDAVTGRALAPLGIQLELAAPWTRVGGAVVPFRTPADAPECENINVGVLGLELERLEFLELPGGEGRRLFPIFRKLRKTPPEYPRAWARIKAKPLVWRPSP